MARNTSDSIEEYIKELLGQSGTAEIQRSNLADAFQVVPSQINYVIKTRFTESRGYIVESKRGGGGLATASDDVLGADAAATRSRILRSLLLRLDRKGN